MAEIYLQVTVTYQYLGGSVSTDRYTTGRNDLIKEITGLKNKGIRFNELVYNLDGSINGKIEFPMAKWATSVSKVIIETKRKETINDVN